MAKVGVLLSGCGFLDGAEIHESVFTLLALDQKKADIVCCAPNINVTQVIDHQTRQPSGETRNVLKEAARIARCEISDVCDVSASDIDALIIPGGFGAAKNLCSFADDGADCTVNPDVEKLITNVLEQKKPIGAICIAPALLARVLGNCGIKGKVTIGSDKGTAGAILATGCQHEDCATTEISYDAGHKIVSTPAYMLGPSPAPVFEGIRKLVDKVLQIAG